jgi:hypothetical protein
MKARSNGSGAPRSASTSAAMSIAPWPPCPAIPGTIGIWSIGGVWSEPNHASRQAFIWPISPSWAVMIASAIWAISGCSARSRAILAISTAP